MTNLQQEFQKLQETKRHNREMEAQGREQIKVDQIKAQASNVSAQASVSQATTSAGQLEETKRQNRFRNIGSIVTGLVNGIKSVGGTLFR